MVGRQNADIADTLQLRDVAMATTFTQCAPKAIEFAEITQNNGIMPFKVIQGHRFGYQSKVHMRLPISD